MSTTLFGTPRRRPRSSVRSRLETVVQSIVRVRVPPLLLLLITGCSTATTPVASSVVPQPPTPPPDSICPAEGVEPTEPALLAVRERLRTAVAADSAVSVSIAVLAGDRIVWSEAFGFAERDQRIDATAATPYAVASVTKPVTAAAVLLLVERGALDLNRPVNEYLDDDGVHGPPDWTRRVTVRTLLQHRAGLPRHFHFIYADEEYRRPPLDETIRRYGFTAYPPDVRSVYSNLGYGMLERLIEGVTGRPYGAYVEAEVFRRVGIRDAWVGLPDGRSCPSASAYSFQGARLPHYDFDHRGASAVFATAESMARFGAAHFEHPPSDLGALLSPMMRTRIRAEAVADRDGPRRGLGWTVRRHASGHELIEHSGGMPGALAMLRVAPEAGISVFAVSNSETSGLPGMVSADVLDALLPDAQPPSSGVRDEKRSERSPADPPAQPSELSGRWCGDLRTWRQRLPLELSISASGDSAWVAWPERGGQLVVENFEVDADGRITGQLNAMVDTPDASRSPHYVELDLWPLDGVLTGSAVALAVPPRARRVHYGLPSYVHLRSGCSHPSPDGAAANRM